MCYDGSVKFDISVPHKNLWEICTPECSMDMSPQQKSQSELWNKHSQMKQW